MSLEVNSNNKNLVNRKNKQRGSKRSSSTLKSNNLIDCNMANLNRYHGNHQNYIPNFNISGSCSYSVPFHCIQDGPMSLPTYPLVHTSGANYLQYNNGPNSCSYSNPNSVMHSEPSEYMSLPVVNTDENENTSDRRRFSDPGLLCDSDSSSQSYESRMIKKLMQEIESLKESNRKLNREVLELRMEINMMKQQQSMKYGEREYEPGMLSDVIKEIRDAARVREDALLSKVKHMIEEKQFSVALAGIFQTHLHMASEKSRHSERLAKLEEQMKNLSTSNAREEITSSDDGPNSTRQVLELERETLSLRRELQEARAKKEESDQKLIQLDKKLAALLHQKELVSSTTSDDGKASSCTDLISLSSGPYLPQRVTLTGPVTDL